MPSIGGKHSFTFLPCVLLLLSYLVELSHVKWCYSLWWKMKWKVLSPPYLLSWSSQNIYTQGSRRTVCLSRTCLKSTAQAGWVQLGIPWVPDVISSAGPRPPRANFLEYLHGKVKLEVCFCLCCLKSSPFKVMIAASRLSGCFSLSVIHFFFHSKASDTSCL